MDNVLYCKNLEHLQKINEGIHLALLESDIRYSGEYFSNVYKDETTSNYYILIGTNSIKREVIMKYLQDEDKLNLKTVDLGNIIIPEYTSKGVKNT